MAGTQVAMTVCAALLAMHHPRLDTGTRRTTCAQVVQAAARAGVDVAEAAALGWRESKMHPTIVSSAGARGPLQVTRGVCDRWRTKGKRSGERKAHPQWRGCDLVAAGVWEWKRLRAQYHTARAACFYNAGPACPRVKASQQWGRGVAALAAKLTLRVSAPTASRGRR